MDLCRLQIIAILLGFLQSNAEATLPSVEFIAEFVAKHQRSSVTLHIPDSEKTTDCKNWYICNIAKKKGYLKPTHCTLDFFSKGLTHFLKLMVEHRVCTHAQACNLSSS